MTSHGASVRRARGMISDNGAGLTAGTGGVHRAAMRRLVAPLVAATCLTGCGHLPATPPHPPRAAANPFGLPTALTLALPPAVLAGTGPLASLLEQQTRLAAQAEQLLATAATARLVPGVPRTLPAAAHPGAHHVFLLTVLADHARLEVGTGSGATDGQLLGLTFTAAGTGRAVFHAPAGADGRRHGLATDFDLVAGHVVADLAEAGPTFNVRTHLDVAPVGAPGAPWRVRTAMRAYDLAADRPGEGSGAALTLLADGRATGYRAHASEERPDRPVLEPGSTPDAAGHAPDAADLVPSITGAGDPLDDPAFAFPR